MHGIDGKWREEMVGKGASQVRPAPPPRPPEFTDADCDELQFSLQELFFGVTIAAVMLALFRSTGIFGAVLSFLAAWIFTVLGLPRLLPDNTAKQRKYFDFVWGVVMPVVCLVFDPFFFKHGAWDPLNDNPLYENSGIHPNPIAFVAWPMIGGQIVTLLFVLIAGKSMRRIAPLLAGALGVGFLVAILLTIGLILPAFFGTFFYYGVGLLGFTPILTAITFQRRMVLMLDLGSDMRPAAWHALLWLGILIYALIPCGLGILMFRVTTMLYLAP